MSDLKITNIQEIEVTTISADKESISSDCFGQGAFSVIYGATFRGKECACKRYTKRSNASNMRDPFLREVKALKKLKHPNIVEMYGYYVSDKLHDRELIVVMERAKTDLGNIIFPQPLDNEVDHRCVTIYEVFVYNGKHVINWIRQITDALEFVHKSDIIHRDIKPENVLMFNDYETCKLCDFNIGTKQENSTTRYMTTDGYAAPELIASFNAGGAGDAGGRGYDEKVDIYSFGQVLTDLMYRCSERREPQMNDLHPDLADVIRRCTATDPRWRPSARELHDMCGDWFSRMGGPPREKIRFYRVSYDWACNTCEYIQDKDGGGGGGSGLEDGAGECELSSNQLRLTWESVDEQRQGRERIRRQQQEQTLLQEWFLHIYQVDRAQLNSHQCRRLLAQYEAQQENIAALHQKKKRLEEHRSRLLQHSTSAPQPIELMRQVSKMAEKNDSLVKYQNILASRLLSKATEFALNKNLNSTTDTMS